MSPSKANAHHMQSPIPITCNADESQEANDTETATTAGSLGENAQQNEERASSGAAAEALTQTLDSNQRHTRGASMGYLVPPELAALTAFLKACNTPS